MSASFEWSQCSTDPLFRDQIDNILGDESPDPLLPDLSIFMGESVPLADDPSPRYLVVLLLEIIGYAPGSLSNNLQEPLNCELQLAVLLILLKGCPVGETSDRTGCIEHIPEIRLIFQFRRHTGFPDD
jgi:hypothetical protein